MSAIAKPRRKAAPKKKTPQVKTEVRHAGRHEAPDWGEPIREAPEFRLIEREAPDAGEGVPYESDY